MARHIFSGAGAPATTPTDIGHHYVDTTNGITYISAGTTSSADWKEVGGSGEIAAHLAAADPHSQYVLDTDNRLSTQYVLKVKKNPGAGEYSTIEAALADATGATATSPILIDVGPGTFVENELTPPAYVSIQGSTIQTTIVKVANASQHLFNLSTGCELSFLSLEGLLGAGKVAVRVHNVGDFAQMHKVSIYDFDIGIEHIATTGNSFLYVEYTDINGDYTNAVKTYSTGSFSNRTQLENFYAYESLNTSAETIKAYGDGTEVQLFAFKLFMEPTQKGVVMSDLALLRCNSAAFHNGETAIEVLNTGGPSGIYITSTDFINNGNDLVVGHSGTYGSIQAGADKSKVSIPSGANISLLITDTVAEGTIVNGPLYYSPGDYSQLADVSQIITRSPTMGLYYGGDLTAGAGRVLNIAAGYGYLHTGTDPNMYLVKHIWTADTLTIPASSAHYVYMNAAGTFVSNATQPDTSGNIILGRVITDASLILYIENAPINGHHWSNLLARTLREAVGPIFKEGSLVAESGTRNLDVTPGEYYYSENEFLPAGGTAIAFDTFYESSTPGVYTRTAGVTTVDNGYYDNASGTLAAIPSGKYAKHSLHLVGGPSEKYLMIYANAYYNTQAEAEAAPLPIVPGFIKDSFTRVASLVVSPSSSSIVSILDERPRIGFASSLSSGTVTSHSALSNLGSDDHTQYLLASGSRAMSGSLDMGANNITNVGTVDGVDVSAHASRHLPNGADPLSTGAPSTIGTANETGTANALARQDHVHAHGSHSSGTDHAEATSLVAGFMPANDKIKLDSVTAAELSRLSGVTSSIQTQLDGKQATGNYITALTGDVTADGPGSAAATLASSGVTAGTYVYATVTVDAKGRVTSAANGVGGMIMIVTTAIQTSTSTTHADVTELVTGSLAVGLYEFDLTGLYRSTAAGTGIGFRLVQGTATITTINARWDISQAASGVGQDFQYKQLDQAVNITSSSVAAANTNQLFYGGGIFRVTAAGTVKIQFRSETGTAVSIRPESFLRIISY